MQNNPQWKILHTPNGINELIEEIKASDLVAFDTETTGLDKDAKIIGASFCTTENHAWYLAIAEWDVINQTLVYFPGMKEAVKEVITHLTGKTLIAHNALYDVQVIENNYKISLVLDIYADTMILAHILDENSPVGLKELGKRYINENAADEAAEVKASVQANGGKVTKTDYEMYKADWRVIAKYGAKDPWMTYMIFMDLLPKLYEEGLDEFFFTESMPLLRGPTYEMNKTGLKVDQLALTTLKKTLEAECAEHKEFINSEIHQHIKTK